MKKNMGMIDKSIRIVIAAVIGVLFFTHLISGTAAIVLVVFGVVLLLTSLLGNCPLYGPLGINTGKK